MHPIVTVKTDIVMTTYVWFPLQRLGPYFISNKVSFMTYDFKKYYKVEKVLLAMCLTILKIIIALIIVINPERL
jgi:hypothetical protein